MESRNRKGNGQQGTVKESCWLPVASSRLKDEKQREWGIEDGDGGRKKKDEKINAIGTR